jgi:hypothetical protein
MEEERMEVKEKPVATVKTQTHPEFPINEVNSDE